MEFVLASNNPDKLDEIRHILSEYGITIYSLKDMNIHCDPEETGTTFAENACIKAKAIAQFTDKVVIADDSGLEIEALDGFPGVYSARYMEGRPYEEKFVGLNKMLEGKENRTADFNCTLCVVNLTREPLYFEGKVFGTILKEPRGKAGFGYDPIFFYKEKNKTLAEIPQAEKNTVSHRGNAIRMFLQYLKDNKLV